MSAEIGAALSRWPNVPACYGWVTLDARGRWRLGADAGEIVHHPGLMAFLNQNYASTERGEWFVQNGPQRAFVNLARAPHVVRLDEKGELLTHTGRPVQHVTDALVDADGNVYLVCEHGLAGIDDRDLPALIEVDDAQEAAPIVLRVASRSLPLAAVEAAELPERFGYVERPEPDSVA